MTGEDIIDPIASNGVTANRATRMKIAPAKIRRAPGKGIQFRQAILIACAL